MSLIKILFLFIILLSADIIIAQDKVIKIWGDKIPGAINESTVVEDTIIIKNSRRIRKVTSPELILFLPKENANGTAVLICPGGGYERLAIAPEGIDIAHWLNSIGVAAFVLKYRLPDDRIMMDKTVGPLQDAQEALRIIRRNAKMYNISPDKIGVIGFSAGGHLASSLAVHYDDDIYDADNISARPDFEILVYPVISMSPDLTHKGSREHLLGSNPTQEIIQHFSNEQNVNKNTPPAFIVHSFNDETVPVQNSIQYYLALKENNVPSELHIYEKGGHGYGLGKNGSTESGWSSECEKWLKASGYIKE